MLREYLSHQAFKLFHSTTAAQVCMAACNDHLAWSSTHRQDRVQHAQPFPALFVSILFAQIHQQHVHALRAAQESLVAGIVLDLPGKVPHAELAVVDCRGVHFDAACALSHICI